MTSLPKSKSLLDLRECYTYSDIQDQYNHEYSLAKTSVIIKQDLLHNQNCHSILGKSLTLKNLTSSTFDFYSLGLIFRPLNNIPTIYKESSPEIEYQKRLKSLVSFLKSEGESLRSDAFYTIIQRTIEEFKPSLFLELFHPDLANVNNE